MWRVYSSSLYCAIAFYTMAFLRVKPAIALDSDVNAQVVPLSLTKANITEDIAPIFLGRRSVSPYVVIVPTSSLDEARSYLDSIRAKVSSYGQTVFVSSHSLGPYIYVASFNQRHKAESFLRSLHESRARVVYFP
jgi:hypothetical protein